MLNQTFVQQVKDDIQEFKPVLRIGSILRARNLQTAAARRLKFEIIAEWYQISIWYQRLVAYHIQGSQDKIR